VTVKGSIQPVKLFTVDVDFDGMKSKQYKLARMGIKEKRKLRDTEKKKMMASLFEDNKKHTTTWKIFQRDRDFKELRRHYDRGFTKKFNEAYKKYIAGDWATAEDLFSQCLKMNPKDGPTITLKSYIEENNGIPPNPWKGYRELTEK
jgi:TolA-binding protein